MTSRLDRLLLLLDTGSSTSVRTTAAKQLAQLAAKSITTDVPQSDDVKQLRLASTVADAAAWAELMAVVARILPFLHSKSHDTRTAASNALSQIATLVPLWRPTAGEEGDMKVDPSAPALEAPEFPRFSVEELLTKGTLLLASSGAEYVVPTGLLGSPQAVARARKAAMARLGLDFLDNVGVTDDTMDWDRELAGDDATATEPAMSTVSSLAAPEPQTPGSGGPTLVKSDSTSSNPPQSKPSTPVPAMSAPPVPQPQQAEAPEPDLSNLSARERNRLKRKRKPGNSAFVSAPPSQGAGAKYNPTTGTSQGKVRLVDTDDSPPPPTPREGSPSGAANAAGNDTGAANGANGAEKVIIDPTKGGAVSPKSQQQSRALEAEPGLWPWDGLIRLLEVDLFSPAWETRHGAAMALRELLKAQGACGGMRDGVPAEENSILHERWCNELATKLLCIFVLDRFGDFVSDQVIAPVRETASQTLAALLLHMPARSAAHVHALLLQMVRQDFPLPARVKTAAPPPPPARRGVRPASQSHTLVVHPEQKEEPAHVWEVRHAGLLGIKYEVAVRPDLVGGVKLQESDTGFVKLEEGIQPDVARASLRDVVDAAILGLGDRDDDVRSVAASCLLPVAEHVVRQLPDVLSRVLGVLWSCLAEMKDDLSSSVGAVMDLLGKLVSYDEVIAILADDKQSLPITSLAPTLYPFFRHTISNVRLAVVKTLHAFMVVESLSRDWVAAPFLCLLLQNLVVEERVDVREETLVTWDSALDVLASAGLLVGTLNQQLVLGWYELTMTPMGTPLNVTTFYMPVPATDGVERHNVDRNMIAQDLALVTSESVFNTRIAAATALARLIVAWPLQDNSWDELFRPILMHYVDSTSMLQKFLCAIVIEEWARAYRRVDPQAQLFQTSPLAAELSGKLLVFLQSPPPAAYHEMVLALSRLHVECSSMIQAFTNDCRVPASSAPVLGTAIDPTGADPTAFTIETARTCAGSGYEALVKEVPKGRRKDLTAVAERRAKISAAVERYAGTKVEYDVRVSAAFAAAFIALRSAPDKVSPIVKGIMNGIKDEENVHLQTRSAVAVAAFVDFCAQHKLVQPPEKIVRNLCTFLCQDIDHTPTFAFARKQTTGILSFQAPTKAGAANGKGGSNTPADPSAVDQGKARLARRGASLAFDQLSVQFGAELFDVIPGMWKSMVGGLLSACPSDEPSEADALMNKQHGQDVIDSLSVLEAIVPALHEDLWPRLISLFPKMLVALKSRYAVIRQSAARCFATVCSALTVDGMRYVIENVIPLLGDALSLSNRQGAVELVYHIIEKLDIKALPYVIFMVVPVLGRMSDPDDDVRSTATNTFASLVKMVPLEAGLPDPPGFSKDLLERRETERQFLTQLLDGKKVEQYVLPVAIKAELRPYQQEGVNWLAFLAKYQLHGILCDDMGLGKTLQSICILASKHFERRKRYQETKSPDAVHLPSLIVCPPTLTGHWYYEILKYAENLKPILYTGTARDRSKLVPKLKSYDVVITSYEVVRNDITQLEKLSWNYCILDEGHVIKNAKTKLTKAVKCIRADHRLILSGTPIQNNVLELWSLFDFLMPGFLGTESSFNERFSKPILSNREGKSKNGEAAALALEALHKQVLPFLLRRLKEDVLNDLPPKIIQDYYCDLSDVQKHLYDDFSKSQAAQSVQNVVQSTSSGESKGQQHVFQSLQYLRKLCNHPALVLKDDTEAISGALTKVGAGKTTLNDIQHAPKLLALRQLLNDCGIGGSATGGADSAKGDSSDALNTPTGAFSQHRALIFCQMKQMLNIIEQDLFRQHMPSVTYMRLDGDTDSSKRHAVVQTFNADPSIDCLLLTTHVGGLGLTLTGADTVIFVEHDWNPMKDLQAMDRAHRIGQKKVVNVYRLITRGTLEEKIMGLQRFKLNIANSVVTQQNAGLASMDTDLVLDLFKRTTEEEDAAAAAKKKAKEANQPVNQKNVLQGLEDLPPEEEYEGLDLSSFMSSIKR